MSQGPNKPLPVIAIDGLKPLVPSTSQPRPQPSSMSTSSVDPVGGILTSSNMPLLFDHLEIDPIFQQASQDSRQQQQQQHQQEQQQRQRQEVDQVQQLFVYPRQQQPLVYPVQASNVAPWGPPPQRIAPWGPPAPENAPWEPPPPAPLLRSYGTSPALSAPPPLPLPSLPRAEESPASNDSGMDISDADVDISLTQSDQSVASQHVMTPNSPKTLHKETFMAGEAAARLSQKLAKVANQTVTTSPERADLSTAQNQDEKTRKLPAVGGDGQMTTGEAARLSQELAKVTTDQNATMAQEAADLSTAQTGRQDEETRKRPAGGENDMYVLDSATESEDLVSLPCVLTPKGPKAPQKETLAASETALWSRELENVTTDQNAITAHEREDMSAALKDQLPAGGDSDQNAMTTQERAAAQQGRRGEKTQNHLVGGENDHHMNLSDKDLSDTTPPLLDSSRDADNAILNKILEKIDRDIVRYEEKALLERIRLSIVAAEEAAKPGGRVCYVAALKNGVLEEEDRPLLKDPLYDDVPPKRFPAAYHKFGQGPGSHVLDLEDAAKEVSRMIKLPRYAKDSKLRLISRERLQEFVVDGILAPIGNCFPARKLSVRLKDDTSDSYSVILHSQGHPELVDQVESRITSFIRTTQHPLRERHVEEAPRVVEPSRTKNRGTDRSPISSQTEERQSPNQAAFEKHRPKGFEYRKFLETYNDVKDIEYTGSGLHKHHINGCMWASHKNCYGTSCSEECECPRDVKFLTSTVVGLHFKKERKKDSSWKNPLAFTEDESPVGFVNHFVPKFFPMLESEFPHETPKQILTRLVLMWREHRKNQRFGIKCNKNCTCIEGWEIVFQKGRLLEGERVAKDSQTRVSATARLARRPSKDIARNTAPRSSTSQLASVPCSTPIPRRPSKEIANAAASHSSTTQYASAQRPMAVPRRSSKDTAHTATSSTTAAVSGSRRQTQYQPKPYEIEFRSGEAMGFFCITEQMKDGSVCKIAVLSSSARSKDTRLQPGTEITDAAVGVGSTMQQVRTHTDLRMLFDDARHRQTFLRVRFINMGLPNSLIANMPVVVAEPNKYGKWTKLGEWKGSSEGWPGGARCSNPKEGRRGGQRKDDRPTIVMKQTSLGNEPRNLSSTEQTTRASAPTTFFSSSDRHLDVPSTVAKSLDLQYSSSMAPARHRELPTPGSIFREATDWTTKSSTKDTDTGLKLGPSIQQYMPGHVLAKHTKPKVKFTDGFERRFYDPKTESFRMITVVSGQQASNDSSKSDALAEKTPVVPIGEALIDAVQHKGLKDVIALLQAGACPTTRDEHNKEPKDYVKSRLEALEPELRAHPENQEIAAQARDFHLKRRVLSIFIEAIFTIDKARFNKKWERIDFKIDKIENIRLTVSGEDHNGSNLLDCRVLISKGKQRPMSLISIDQCAGEWRNPRSTMDFAFKYNGSLMASWPSHAKEIIISVYKGDKNRDITKPILLSEIIIPFSRIVAEAEGGSGIIREEFEPNEFLASGAISITAKKILDKKPRESKSKEAAAKLLEVTTNIKQFNSETGADGTKVPSLSTQIVAPYGGISLLHAAIYLDEPDLVKRLVELGADPAAPSDVGSARMLATNLLGDRQDQKSREILRFLTGSAPNAEIDSNDVHFPSETLDADAQDDASHGTHSMNKVAEQEAGKYLTGGEVLEEEAQPKKRRRRFDEGSAEALSTRASTSTATSIEETLAQRIDSLTERASNMYENTPPVQAGDAIMAWPTLDYWFFKGEKRCFFFNRPGGCRYGKGCSNLHVSPPMGNALDDTAIQMHDVDFDRSFVTTRQLPNDSGRWFYTAAYRDPRADNTVFVAEHGHAVGQNTQGIHWYNSEDDAEDALKKVVMVARTTNDKLGRRKRSRDVAYSPDSAIALEPYEAKEKRARHEGDAASPPALNNLFFRLLHSNLSTVFVQITGQSLRKTDWTTRQNGSLYTATLISPLVRDRGAKYYPTDIQGGRWFDGAWWHTTERRAKASAFETYMKSCIRRGILDKDCTTTKEGKRLQFKA